MKLVLVVCAVGLYYLICLGVDLLPWNKEKDSEG